MQRDSDEDAWRAIVDNYGERIELDEDPAADADPGETRGTESNNSGLARLFRPLPEPQPDAAYAEKDEDDDPEDGFVPPEPPPLPKLPPDRFLAWSGLFGSPTVLLVCVVFDIHLMPWLAYLLVASFIGGFVYLVVNMPHSDDADPWDDGARL